jgi:hypothetical protein
MSRPVAVAFGIDRTAPLLRTDGDLTTFRWTTVNGVVRKGVCGRCNSGWMKDLEHRMTDVAEWMKGSPTEPLGEDRELTVRSWAIKTHMLLCFIDGDAARLGEDGFGHAVVAPFSLARAAVRRRSGCHRGSGGRDCPVDRKHQFRLGVWVPQSGAHRPLALECELRSGLDRNDRIAPDLDRHPARRCCSNGSRRCGELLANSRASGPSPTVTAGRCDADSRRLWRPRRTGGNSSPGTGCG